MKDGIFRIAQFGTYDIESLGDTSFPKMLAYGLKKQSFPAEIELFSMTELEKTYNGNGHVYSFAQFPDRQAAAPFDAVVIGGGEFIHFAPMAVIINGEQTAYPKGYIWKKPIEMAKAAGVPYVINCVGVSYDMTPSEQKEIKEYLKDAVFVAVRDHYSAERLSLAGLTNVRLVADNLWYMNEMYPKETLAEKRAALEVRTGRNLSTPYILVQYGTTKNAAMLASQLQDFKRENRLRVLLMPVNYCHEDREGMRLLYEAGRGTFEAVDDYFEPEEMISVIAGARAFIGTSLHGNLTAASYGVPFVGIDMYASFVSKMDGIFSMIGCEEYLVPSECGVKAALSARLADGGRGAFVAEKIRTCQAALDRHFADLANLLKGDV